VPDWSRAIFVSRMDFSYAASQAIKF